jgi:hypothetical protein
VFTVMYELNFYILFRRNSVFNPRVQADSNASTASRRRRRKVNSVSGCITGPLSSFGTLIRGPGPPGWRNIESDTVKDGHESRGTRVRE